jgi:prepilin-type N-terminal cleavage/methylation domain-containing protein
MSRIEEGISRRSSAFTLIELLVVIAIIAPALGLRAGSNGLFMVSQTICPFVLLSLRSLSGSWGCPVVSGP